MGEEGGQWGYFVKGSGNRMSLCRRAEGTRVELNRLESMLELSWPFYVRCYGSLTAVIQGLVKALRRIIFDVYAVNILSAKCVPAIGIYCHHICSSSG